MLESLKKEFLELLEKDLEFRYTVAGYLGLSEILRRLDKIAEEQLKLREEQITLREEQVHLRKEQVRLAEEQIKLREEQARLVEEQIQIRKEQARLVEEQIGLRKEQTALREEQIRLTEEQIKLREDFNRMLLRIERIDDRLGRVERTLEKLTIDVEDEAKSVLKARLRELGVSLELTSLILPGLEINIYGVSDDVCVIGEATLRAGPKPIDELLEKIEKLKINYPNLLRRKVILVIYASLPMIELIEKAKEKGIWLLKATEEFFKPGRIFHEV